MEFSAKDRDNNEKISLAELELLFEGLDKNYDVNKIMTVADTNGDNVIDFREFVRMNLDKDKWMKILFSVFRYYYREIQI